MPALCEGVYASGGQPHVWSLTGNSVNLVQLGIGVWDVLLSLQGVSVGLSSSS